MNAFASSGQRATYSSLQASSSNRKAHEGRDAFVTHGVPVARIDELLAQHEDSSPLDVGEELPGHRSGQASGGFFLATAGSAKDGPNNPNSVSSISLIAHSAAVNNDGCRQDMVVSGSKYLPRSRPFDPESVAADTMVTQKRPISKLRSVQETELQLEQRIMSTTSMMNPLSTIKRSLQRGSSASDVRQPEIKEGYSANRSPDKAYNARETRDSRPLLSFERMK